MSCYKEELYRALGLGARGNEKIVIDALFEAFENAEKELNANFILETGTIKNTWGQKGVHPLDMPNASIQKARRIKKFIEEYDLAPLYNVHVELCGSRVIYVDVDVNIVSKYVIV